MSGYTPVFRSVFEGSLCGQYPDTAAWVFLLALQDKNGNIDMTPQYISAITGMPVDDLMGCIERFMQPDPASRSDTEDGRRLVPIDPSRPWGWHVVNYMKYREKARKMGYDAARTASGADAARKAVSRDVPRSPAPSRSHTQTHTHTQTQGERASSDAPPARKGSKNCPEDWTPSASLLARITAEDVAGCLARGGTSVEMELERFRSCTFSTARSDWDKTAWNWLLTECKRINQKEVMYGASRGGRR